MIYIIAQIVCFSYAAVLIGLYTLVASTGQLDPSLNSAETLLQDLTAIRIWIVIGGLTLYSWLLASKASTAMTLAVLYAGLGYVYRGLHGARLSTICGRTPFGTSGSHYASDILDGPDLYLLQAFRVRG